MYKERTYREHNALCVCVRARIHTLHEYICLTWNMRQVKDKHAKHTRTHKKVFPISRIHVDVRWFVHRFSEGAVEVVKKRKTSQLYSI